MRSSGEKPSLRRPLTMIQTHNLHTEKVQEEFAWVRRARDTTKRHPGLEEKEEPQGKGKKQHGRYNDYKDVKLNAPPTRRPNPAGTMHPMHHAAWSACHSRAACVVPCSYPSSACHTVNHVCMCPSHRSGRSCCAQSCTPCSSSGRCTCHSQPSPPAQCSTYRPCHCSLNLCNPCPCICSHISFSPCSCICLKFTH